MEDENLSWRVPLGEIVNRIQTIGGIARLVGADASTIYRNRIKPGSLRAFTFALEWTRDLGWPLVSLDGFAWAPLHRGSRLLRWGEVSEYIDATRNVNALDDPEGRGKRMRWKGNHPRYHPIGRVTVVEICHDFGINRRAFYRWKANLLPQERADLEDALRP